MAYLHGRLSEAGRQGPGEIGRDGEPRRGPGTGRRGPRREVGRAPWLAVACLAAAWAAAGGAGAEATPERAGGYKAAASLTGDVLERYGINPAFIVAVRVTDDGRLLLAEHRPGADSTLHVLKPDGDYGYPIAVRSPQLADFTVDSEDRVLLVGSLGTRFYTADLADRSSKLILSSLPNRPGFRALPPVSITRAEGGPVVYGLFYDSKDASREVGFGRVDEDGTAVNALATERLGEGFGQALSYMPDSRLKSTLVVAQEARKEGAPEGSKPGPNRLLLVDDSGKTREIDTGDEIFGLAWSPIGSSFAYIRRRGDRQDLVAASAGKAAPLVLASGKYFGPVFMNRGKELVVALKEPKGMSVWTMRFPSGLLERLDLPEGPCVYVASPSGAGLAAWGPWGLRAFARGPG